MPRLVPTSAVPQTNLAGMLTQGAIVQGIRIPRYDELVGHGFLITARCDLAHVRTDVLNFLPIVPLRDWLRLDGALSILLARVAALEEKVHECVYQLDRQLDRIFVDQGWSQVFRTYVEPFAEPNGPYSGPIVARLRAALEELDKLRAIYGDLATQPAKIRAAIEKDTPLAAVFKARWEDKIRDLLTHKVADAHYVPRVDSLEVASEGYALMFRQILAVPGVIAPYLERGIPTNKILADDALRLTLETCLDLRPHQVVGIVSNVSSPEVEHIMQRFAELYTRIGVQDLPRDHADRVVRRLREERE